MSKTIKICDCTLRDGQQSLIATRMRIEDMLPILSKMDEIGLVPWKYGVVLHLIHV